MTTPTRAVTVLSHWKLRKAAVVLVQPPQVHGRGQSHGGQQEHAHGFRQQRPDEIGGHAHQDPAHELAHPQHPLPRPGQLLQAAGKHGQEKQGQAQAQAEGEEHQEAQPRQIPGWPPR